MIVKPLKPCHGDNAALFQFFFDSLGFNIVNSCTPIGIISVNSRLKAEEGAGIITHGFNGHGEKGHANLFAGGYTDIKFPGIRFINHLTG